jgi:hypothetical protein
MASLYIEEFEAMGTAANGQAIQAPLQVSLATQKLTIGVAVASEAFHARTKYVQLHADAVCSYRFSIAGTDAAVTNMRMPANADRFFVVPPGVGMKVSVITNT